MEWKIIQYGINVDTDKIWVIQKDTEKEWYSGYSNSLSYGYPKGMKLEDMEQYLIEHDTEGYSCDGSYMDVRNEVL